MPKTYPFYVKSTIILFGLTLLVYGLFNLKEILIPLAFALMLAMLLDPFVIRFQKLKMRKIFAIILAMLIAFLVLSVLFYFLSTQILRFADQVPVFKRRFAELLGHVQYWVNKDLGIEMAKQNQWLNQANENLQKVFGRLLGTILGSISVVFLLPIYTFLFLFYKTLILNFLFELFAEENSTEVNTVLQQTRGAIQNYMFGLLLETIIVSTLNVAALLLFKVQYAVLLGVLGGILNLLPYIGGIIAIALPVVIATITKDGYQTQIGILVAYSIIQFIDNNILVPLVVSSKVRINALISIIGVLLGAGLWGISGMFLSIPFIGVLKIVFDRIPELKPWGKLLGDVIPTRHKGTIWLRRKQVVKVVAPASTSTTTTTTSAQINEVANSE
jgi:predicted PurR-regulated permease PerM